MQINEFLEETTKMEKFYGKQLEQYEKDVWYENLKYLPVKRYIEIIKKLYVENKFMPKLADILEINKQIPIIKPVPTKVKCAICKSKGFIIYKKIIKELRDEPYIYVARCNCANGNNYLAYPSISEVNIK